MNRFRCAIGTSPSSSWSELAKQNNSKNCLLNATQHWKGILNILCCFAKSLFFFSSSSNSLIFWRSLLRDWLTAFSSSRRISISPANSSTLTIKSSFTMFKAFLKIIVGKWLNKGQILEWNEISYLVASSSVFSVIRFSTSLPIPEIEFIDSCSRYFDITVNVTLILQFVRSNFQYYNMITILYYIIMTVTYEYTRTSG